MDIKVLGVAGSPYKDGNTEVFLREVLKAVEEIAGVSTDFISLAGKKIEDCRECNWCARKQDESTFCNTKDDMTGIYPKLIEADVILLATPVYFWRLSGYMAVFIDRLRCLIVGKYYGFALKDKVGGALAVGRFRNGGLETALLTVQSGLVALQMIPVAYSGFGAAALSTHGGTGRHDPEDRLAVLKDKQGLAGARFMARNAVRLARIVKAGQETLKKEGPDPFIRLFSGQIE